jgi:hypothetical protein
MGESNADYKFECGKNQQGLKEVCGWRLKIVGIVGGEHAGPSILVEGNSSCVNLQCHGLNRCITGDDD